MADTIEKVETNIEGRDRDDIGNSKEENQFNFGAGVHQEVDPRWKHPGEWQYEEDGMIDAGYTYWDACLFTIIPLSVVMLIAAVFINPKPKGKPLSEEPENHR